MSDSVGQPSPKPPGRACIGPILGGCGISGGSLGMLVYFLFHFGYPLFFPPAGGNAQEQAVNTIKWWHGDVYCDEQAPGKPPVRVELDYTFLGDKGLQQLKGPLESLPRLRSLKIGGMTLVTDAGLAELKGLNQLESLELYCTGVTRAGVEDLRKALPTVKISFSPHGGPVEVPPGFAPRPGGPAR